MNCVMEGCKHVKWLDGGFKESHYLKRVLIPYCELGKEVSYPFIDDGKKDMRCKCFVKEERREDDTQN